MNKTKINEFQSIIEAENGDYVFRFTESFKNDVHELRLNEIAELKFKEYNSIGEIAEVTNGISKFIWSDDTTISILKQFPSDVSDEDLDEFISELKRGFHLD